MPRKIFKAEMWDKMQYLFRNYYDRMMHCVLFYEGAIDEDALGRALMFQVGEVDVLHSRYHNNFIKPYWVVKPFSLSDFFTVQSSDDVRRDAVEFAERRIPIKSNVQIRVGLLKGEKKSALVFVVNHMCFDGGDLKYFVIKLCENYTKLVSGDENMEIKHGSRAYDMVYSAMSKEDAKAAKGLYGNVSEVKNKHYFPLTSKCGEDRNRIILRKLSADRFEAARAKGKAMGFTVNDIVLAAYARALVGIGAAKKDDTLTIPCMVDLRRHMAKGGAETGLTNHTGFMTVTLRGIGESTEDTLAAVRDAMAGNKSDKFLGLHSLPLLHLAYTILPHFISEWAIKLGYDNPLIGMSNIGSIKPADYALGEARLVDGFYTGAVKGKPFMQLAFTTLGGEVTFSIAITGNDEDERTVNRFFDLLFKEIDAVAACN